MKKEIVVAWAALVLFIVFLCIFVLSVMIGITIMSRKEQTFLSIFIAFVGIIMYLHSFLESGKLTRRGFWISILGIVVIIVVTIFVA